MPTGTPTQQLANHLLGGTLEQFVKERRPGRAWRLIARDLYEATGIDVTYETLRAWYGDDEAESPPLSRTG